MSLVFSGLSPHPPLLVPAIGQDKLADVERSRAALEALSRAFVERQPDTVVFITPHGPVRSDGVSVLGAANVEAAFTHFKWSCHMPGDVDLADLICDEARKAGFPTIRFENFDSGKNYFSRGLDHATMVPLYYLREAGYEARIVVISMAWWSHAVHYEFGKALRKAIERSDRRVGLLCSGDLSHRLMPSAPAGYEPRGAQFDETITRCLGEMDVRTLLGLDEEFIEAIGECGLRPISMLLGCLEGQAVQSQVLSYEGPFGVGYCVARFDPVGSETEACCPAPPASEEPRPQAEDPVDEGEGDLPAPRDTEKMLDLARQAVEAYVRRHEVLATPVDLPALFAERAGAFVCLKTHGQLRGCIGTLQATQPDLATEIIHNAISACSRDPRFPMVSEQELPDLQFSVDVLEAPERISRLDELDPHRYGVVVRSGSRSGVLLPNLEGIDDVQTQVRIARHKAGIDDGDPHQEYMRFRVRRYERKKD